MGLASFTAGQPGGSGGTALGGGVFFYNNLSGSLSLGISNGSVSNNQVAGGDGGIGGNAGSGGSAHIAGGVGGAGGLAAGGGIYSLAGSAAINTTSLSNVLLENEVVTAGSGGNGGQGEDGNGGQGALAAGGGLYLGSLNTSAASMTNLQGATLASNQVTAGHGGTAGSGTTPNGGAGGNGGGGGNAEGGGLFDGDNNQLTVYNTTIGGVSLAGTPPTAFSNTVIAGDGGNGGNAGTPAPAPTNNGGNGGNGGTVLGGGVYINSGAANFVNNTIVNNQAMIFGRGGAAGQGAGSGGAAGSIGTSGTGVGGGFYTAAPAASNANQIGNTIVDLNSASSSDSDVRGAFTSLGRNLLGSQGDATGFSTAPGIADRTGITAAQLKLGPLQNNGGPAPTDFLLKGSVAIDAGNNSLFPLATINNDERGNGFSRVFNNLIDIGAVEFQPPQITQLSQSSVLRGSGSFTLSIAGTDFLPGAVVNFNGATLTPVSITGSSIVVVIPASTLLHHGTFPLTVSNPDGSGIPGQTLASTPANLTITLPTTLPLNPVAGQSNNENDPVSLSITSPDPDAGHFAATGLPPGLSIDSATGLISGTINPFTAGTYTVVVSATDANTSGTVTFTWTVAATSPPAITNPGNQTNTVGGTVNLTVAISHADPGTVTITGLPPGLSFNTATGAITGTFSSSAPGNYTVTIGASRGGLASSVSFGWTVNVPGGSGGQSSSNSFSFGGLSFNLPPPGQSAGLFGLAIEEFELTFDSDLAFLFSMAGLPNKQFQEPIPALLAAINGDPLRDTPMGSLALMLGYTAALQIL